MVLTAAGTGSGTVPTTQARAQARAQARTQARTLAVPLGAAGAVAVATTMLNRTGGRGLGPLATCWFHAGTGLYCPFCGSLRGVAALTRGDVPAALHDNAPVILLLGVATLLWGRGVLLALAGRAVDQPRITGRASLALAAFFLVFMIYRNTPYGVWLAPLR